MHRSDPQFQASVWNGWVIEFVHDEDEYQCSILGILILVHFRNWREKIRFWGDWAPAETSINSHVLRIRPEITSRFQTN